MFALFTNVTLIGMGRIVMENDCIVESKMNSIMQAGAVVYQGYHGPPGTFAGIPAKK